MKLKKGLYNRNGIIYLRYYDKFEKKPRSVSTGFPYTDSGIRKANDFKDEFLYKHKKQGRLKYAYPIHQLIYLDQGLIDYYSANKLKPRTKELYKLAVEHFITACGNLVISEYNQDHYDTFIEYMNELNLKVNSQSIYTRSLHSLWEYFIKKKYVGINIIERVKSVKKTVRIVKQSDLEILLDYLKVNNRNGYNILYFMLTTGLRSSEAVNIRWSDIDLESDLIFISGKNRDAEQVDMLPLLKQAKDHLLSLDRTTEKIFPYKSRHSLHFYYRAQLHLFNERRYTLHQLRKTYITKLIEGGVDLSAVMILARHSKLDITLSHYYEANLKNISKIASAKVSF